MIILNSVPLEKVEVKRLVVTDDQSWFHRTRSKVGAKLTRELKVIRCSIVLISFLSYQLI